MSYVVVGHIAKHPRRDSLALYRADGSLSTTFAADATREEISAALASAGFVLLGDNRVAERPAFCTDNLPAAVAPAMQQAAARSWLVVLSTADGSGRFYLNTEARGRTFAAKHPGSVIFPPVVNVKG